MWVQFYGRTEGITSGAGKLFCILLSISIGFTIASRNRVLLTWLKVEVGMNFGQLKSLEFDIP